MIILILYLLISYFKSEKIYKHQKLSYNILFFMILFLYYNQYITEYKGKKLLNI